MESGRLRHRVEVQAEAAADVDPHGPGAPGTWSTVATIWADVRPLRAVEIVRAQQPGLETAFVVTMRHTADVTAGSRLKWQGRYLYVKGLTDVGGRGRTLEVLCNQREAAPDQPEVSDEQ